MSALLTSSSPPLPPFIFSASLSPPPSAWAAFINTLNEQGLPDLVLTAIVGGFFLFGFVLGLFNFARGAAIGLIGMAGGLAFGVRVAIIKEGLLFPVDSLYAINWVVAAIFGAAGGLLVIWKQRMGSVRLLEKVAVDG